VRKPPARGLPGGVPVVREAEALEEAIGVDLIYLAKGVLVWNAAVGRVEVENVEHFGIECSKALSEKPSRRSAGECVNSSRVAQLMFLPLVG
jgi:hypothetical protein